MTTHNTLDELDQAASAALAKAAAARAAANQARLEEQQRRADAQRAFDERLVAGFSRARLDQDVEEARERLDAHLAGNPLVEHLANLLFTEYTRRDVIVEHVAALSRLGRPTGGAAIPPPPRVDSAAVAAAADRLASTKAAAARDAHATRRENAGTATTKETT